MGDVVAYMEARRAYVWGSLGSFTSGRSSGCVSCLARTTWCSCQVSQPPHAWTADLEPLDHDRWRAQGQGCS